MVFPGFVPVTEALKGWPKKKIAASEVANEGVRPQLLLRTFLRMFTLLES